MESAYESAYSKSATSYEIKAAFLIKFTDFIQWPDHSFNNDPNHFILGIMGQNVFHHMFDPFIGTKIQGREFMVRHFNGMAELASIANLQMLFICRSEIPHLQTIFDQLNTSGVLTVSDTPEFIQYGGTIVFVKKGNRIGFEINRASEKRAGLKISSDLLQLATRVYHK
ncbi:MAG: transmembrane protein [Candidatus Magnetoglobus multicellularis str. Araruama]|uniref:Transmembrane protein n=1 Tax=Candidatus Magnetoglobus multicellularis str. Araruama TaxID=890399 RepID=A0A1V1P5C3_9BACT|nr:MAG: transmembrane protein [Candidatus Magnetoglobus multicellularis str. Araruama]